MQARAWPFVLAVLATMLLPLRSAEAALQFPEQLSPVADDAAADVRVQMTLSADGVVKKSEVIASSRPESNKAVLEALRDWRFRPALKDDKAVESTGLRGFVFTDNVEVDKAPSLLQTPGALSSRPGEAPPVLAYPAQPMFVESDVAAIPTPMPNEIWWRYPRRASTADLKRDPGAWLDIVVAASGEALAIRESGESKQVSVESLMPNLWKYARFEPGHRAGVAIAARARVPIRFFSMPDPTAGIPDPVFPRELAGMGGTVEITSLVDTEGQIHQPKVRSSPHPLFEASVIDAFTKGRMVPAQRLGKAVAMSWTLKFTYRSRNSPNLAPYRIGDDGPAPEEMPAEFRYDKPPKVRLSIDPVYPFELARDGIAGSAQVTILIDPSGRVRSVKIDQATSPAFGEALKASMESWEFEPATQSGQPTWAAIHNNREFSLSVFSAQPLNASARRILAELKKDPDTGAERPDLPLVRRYQPQPFYPSAQRESGTGDTVTVSYFVDRDGYVQLPHATKYVDEALAWAAVTAVSRWRFDPPKRNGKPIDVRAALSIVFAPDTDTDPAKDGASSAH